MGSKGGTPANCGHRGQSAGSVPPTRSGDSRCCKRWSDTDDESSEIESSEESSEESTGQPPAKKTKGNTKSLQKQIKETNLGNVRMK